MRITRMKVEEEVVRDAAVGRQARAESQSGKQLIRVVVLNYVAHRANSLSFEYSSF